MQYNNKSDGGKQKMVAKNFRLPESLWLQVVMKSNGLISVSALIRRLLEMWVNDEIDVFRKKSK